MAIRTIFKALAGIPDLLWGRGTVSQTRNGTAYSIERIAKIHPVDLLVDLRALATIDPDNQYFEVLLKGTGAINDGNGGDFYFDAASLAVDDGLTIVKPTDIALANPGRWLKQVGTGLNRTGDTATGPIQGVPTTGPADFTRTDYVDLLYNIFLEGPRNDGRLDSYAGDWNVIVRNSVYRNSSITNGPPNTGGIVATYITSTVDTNERLQVSFGNQSGIPSVSIRTTGSGNAGYTTWSNRETLYSSAGKPTLTASSSSNAINRADIQASIASAPVVLSTIGPDTNIDVDVQPQGTGRLLYNGVPVQTTAYRGALINIISSGAVVAPLVEKIVYFGNTVYDTDGLVQSYTGPQGLIATVITIPTGVSRIKLTANIVFQGNGSSLPNYVLAYFSLNDDTAPIPTPAPGLPSLTLQHLTSLEDTTLNISGGVISVVPGDNIYCIVKQDGAQDMTLQSIAGGIGTSTVVGRSWMSVEILE